MAGNGFTVTVASLMIREHRERITGKREPVSGFSLLEMLLVVMLLAVLAALVVPLTFNLINRQQERKRVRELAEVVHTMRLRSVADERSVEMSLRDDALEILSGNDLIKRIEFEGLTVSMPAPIIFNRHGFTTGGHIHLTGRNRYRLIVEQPEGRVRVES